MSSWVQALTSPIGGGGFDIRGLLAWAAVGIRLGHLAKGIGIVSVTRAAANGLAARGLVSAICEGTRELLRDANQVLRIARSTRKT
jgi:hypothetical protein